MQAKFAHQESQPLLFDTLTRLNKIGAAINNLGAEGFSSIKINETLQMIVEGAREVVPGSSAILYIYNEDKRAFDPSSRVSAEGDTQTDHDDLPRSNGIGARAVSERRRVLSYEEADLQIHPAKIAMGARTMACYPLIVANEILGTLYMYLHEDRSLTDLELLMLDNFVNQATMTLSLARQLSFAQNEHVRKSEELLQLRRAGMLISARSSLEETLNTILQMALETMNAKYGTFRLVNEASKSLVTRAVAVEGLEHPATEDLAINRQSIMGIAALDHQPVMVPDLRALPWSEVYYPLDPEVEMRSELVVPLIGASGRLEGVLNLESTQVNAFSEQDQYLLQILADHAVSAIQEVRLLDALQEISALLLTHSWQDVLVHIVEHACDLVNVPVGLLWLIENDKLVLQAGTDEHLLGEQLSIEDSFTGEVIRSGQEAIANNLLHDSRFTRADLAKKQKWGSALVVPLLTREDKEPIGALSVYSHQADLREFGTSEWDKKVMSILAHYAALAVQNSVHLEALRQSQERHAVAETFAAVGDVAANLMHRVTNKVGTIPVRVEGIEQKHGDLLKSSDYLAQNLKEIKHSAAEAMSVVRDGLYPLRPISLETVSIDQCVFQAMNTVELPAAVDVQIRELKLLPKISADQTRLTLVFVNLFENSIEAIQGEGVVEICGKASPGWVEVVFRDNGPGIEPEMQDNVFELSYSGRTTQQPGKLGFGLWWVKTLLARMSGQIAIETTELPGATFVLKFPLEKVNTIG
ncbi:MAG: GAF domain-containing protein [Chloroflexi bacterium]|nr:MAG: GAF domain-containing protein [Chloroflexota bacterium]MBL1193795.1 GAF domain-containing protein [Chloroflexota bacterium]NOH11088.1 GAF domain-containing protein [Chloroflexota bacterium]